MTASSLNRLLLGLILALGGSVAWMFLYGIVWTYWQNQSLAYQAHDESSVVVTRQGEAYIRSIKYLRMGGHIVPKIELLTLNRQPVTLPIGSEVSLNQPAWHVPAEQKSDQLAYRPWKQQAQPAPWSVRTATFIEQGTPAAGQRSWHFLRPDRHAGSGYFVGFDNTTKRRIGYLGVAGFSEDVPEPAQQFAAWSSDGERVITFVPTHYESFGGLLEAAAQPATTLPLLDEIGSLGGMGILAVSPQRDSVFGINLTKRTVRQFPLSGLLSFGNFQTNSFGNMQSDDADEDTSGVFVPAGQEHRVLLRFLDRVEVRTMNFDLVESITLPVELRSKPGESFTLYPVQEGYVAVRGDRMKVVDGQSFFDSSLLWFDQQGLVTRQEQTSQPYATSNISIDLSLASSLEPVGVLTSYWSMLNSPYGLFDVEAQTAIRKAGEPLTWDIGMRAARLMWRQQGFQIVACLIAGVISAALCWQPQRRLGMTRFETIAWSLLTFCFGPIGWIAYVSSWSTSSTYLSKLRR